jgi:hypothetical protein
MAHLAERILDGNRSTDQRPLPDAGAEGMDEVALLKSVAGQIKGKCLCALGEFSIEAVLSGIERFPEDFIVGARSPSPEVGAGSPRPDIGADGIRPQGESI